MAIVVTEDNTGYAPRSDRYSAYDEDRYDGAPDGCTVCGRGATPDEARADLIEEMEAAGYYTADDAAYVRETYGIRPYVDVDYLRDLQEERRAMLKGLDD